MIEIHSHTADVRLKIRGNDLQDLLTEGMRGLNAVLQPVGVDKSRSSHLEVDITGWDLTIVFINFLNDILTSSQINRCKYADIFSLKYEEGRLNAGVKGYPVGAFTCDVKAVTFHEAEIIKTPEGMLETTVILDI